MSQEPPIPPPATRPALPRHRWEALPLVRSHMDAFAAGLRPGEYRTRGDSYELYLARSGHAVEPAPEPVVVVEQAPGVTLRLEIERRASSAARTSSPADLRVALERLLRAALGAAPHE
jgi:hypothetical protein